jgi:hypothetical protein
MHERHVEEMQKDHAHWSTQHGHWLKDVRIWRDQHERLCAAMREVERLIAAFDDLAGPYEHDTTLHEDEVRLHAHELAAKPRAGRHAGDDMHELGRARHRGEEETHLRLAEFHRDVLEAVAKLAKTYGPPSLPWRD